MRMRINQGNVKDTIEKTTAYTQISQKKIQILHRTESTLRKRLCKPND